MPEHLFDAVLGALRQSLGDSWGVPGEGVRAAMHRLRATIDELDGIYIAADPDHGEKRGLRIQLWADRDDLDLSLGDDVVTETLRSLGDREILAVCRTFEDDGIHYRFASG